MSTEPLDSDAGSVPVVRPVVVAGARSAEEIRALCEAATPGPWSFYNGDLWAGATADELALADRLSAEHVFSDEAEDIFDRASHLFHGDPVRPEDAAFIAAARELVPSLLAEVRSLRGVVQAVRELCDERELHDSWRRNFDGSWASHPVLEVPEVRAALAAAADAPQPSTEDCLSLSCGFGEHDKCPNGCDCDCHFGPSPAVLPETPEATE